MTHPMQSEGASSESLGEAVKGPKCCGRAL